MTRCKQPQDGKKRKVISSFQIDVENYFISEFLFFRVFLNKETSESFAYIHRGHFETAIKKLPATSIREEPVAEISVWDKWRTLHTGEVSLASFVKIVRVLGYAEDMMELIGKPRYSSLDEMVRIIMKTKKHLSEYWISKENSIFADKSNTNI